MLKTSYCDARSGLAGALKVPWPPGWSCDETHPPRLSITSISSASHEGQMCSWQCTLQYFNLGLRVWGSSHWFIFMCPHSLARRWLAIWGFELCYEYNPFKVLCAPVGGICCPFYQELCEVAPYALMSLVEALFRPYVDSCFHSITNSCRYAKHVHF